MYVPVHMTTNTLQRPNESILPRPGVKVVSLETQVLGIKLTSSVRVAYTLNC